MAVLIGEFLGAFLALGGIAYIFLGVLMALRVYKRWPIPSIWVAASFAALVGLYTASVSAESWVFVFATIGVCAFVLVRGHRKHRREAAAAPAV